MVCPRPSLLIFACGALAAACGTAGSVSGAVTGPAAAQQVPRTPVQAALAWFRAIDAKDGPQVLAAFAPGNASATSWHAWGPAAWPSFSAVRCQGGARTPTKATVLCTFSESQAPSAGNPVGFWSVSFVRAPHGRWLIDNYGQG